MIVNRQLRLVLRVVIMLAAIAVGIVVARPAVSQQKSRRSQPQVSSTQRNYTISIDDDLVVRRLHPLPMFDDKGKLRKPTAAELREMKGSDPKLKGYKAELSDLKPGQVISVTLAQTKSSAASKAKADTSAKSTENSGSTKPKKAAYTVLGDYSGKLVRLPEGAKEKPKDGKDSQDTKDSIVVAFESLRLSGQPAPAPRDKERLPGSIFVVRIMIVAESPDS